jgi:drug/metabolite transporter (DMT)-like permease|tara:strand:- start:1645 stop:2574 length:930 start_codon:yes stop_codon:yes gene_type:complete
MFSEKTPDKTLGIFLALSAGVWGLYWLPLRSIEELGVSASWSVVLFNACPLVVLVPLLLFNYQQLKGLVGPTILAGLMIGIAFNLYANGLLETTVARATLLYYLTPIWSTLLGVVWLSEPLTKARIIAIGVALIGLFLLLSNANSSNQALNIGDLYSFMSGIFWAIGVSVLNRWATIPILPLLACTFLATTLFSALTAGLLPANPVPDLQAVKMALPAAAFWAIFIFVPSFFIIFRISQLLFPGRVGILTMTEAIVAIVSAAILIPEESMLLLQWLGAGAIIMAGLIEVLFGYSKNKVDSMTQSSVLEK